MELMKLLEKGIVTSKEYDFVCEHEDVKTVENCGNSGLYPSKVWYKLTLTNGEDYNIYL